MEELFNNYKRPKVEIIIIEKFIKLFQNSQSLYKNKEYQKALEELKKSYNLLIDIWDEYPKIKTLFLIMKSYFHVKQYSKCLSLHKEILEKIIIEKNREKDQNKGKIKEKNDLFIKIQAKMEVYYLLINFIYDNLDFSIKSIINMIKYLSETNDLSLEEKVKYFWNYIKTFIKITGITKTNKFLLFKQDYDSMIIIAKNDFMDIIAPINNCVYKPVKKIEKTMIDKYKAFMNSKLKTNLYEILDKEYYLINYGKTNDKVMNFLQKNIHIYVKEHNKVKLVKLFQTFIVLGKINLKEQFNMTMNEILYTQKRRIEKFDIIFANLAGAFNHIFSKYYAYETKMILSKSLIGKNKMILSQNFKEIKKHLKLIKSSSSFNNIKTELNRNNLITSFDFNSINHIKVPPINEEMDQKILLLSKKHKEKMEKYKKNLFKKSNSRLNLKLKLNKSPTFKNIPSYKKKFIFTNYLKSKYKQKEKHKNLPIIINSQRIDYKNNLLNFSDGLIQNINNINETEDIIAITSYNDSKSSCKIKKNRNIKEKENNNFILRNINNILITKLIDIFIPIYKIENNLIFDEEETVKFKNIYPRKIDLYTDLNLPKIITSYYPISIKGLISTENQDAYFFYDDYMLVKNLVLFGVCDGHGKLGYLVSDKICTLFPAYLIYIIIEDNLIKDNKDINKEIYKLFKLKEDPKEVKDMYILRYFFNKFNVDIKSTPLFDDNMVLLKNQIHEAFHYSHYDLKIRYNIDYEFSGTTICSCLILGRTLYTINLGDSQIVLGKLKSDFNTWEVKSLSNRHTFDNPQENLRIIANGGRIERMENKSQFEVGPLRIYEKDKETEIPDLSVSRSIGDNYAKKIGVSYKPEIIKYKLNINDKIIVIGTNGLWKSLTNEEVINIVGKFYMENKNAEEAAIYLTEMAKNKCLEKITNFKRKRKISNISDINIDIKKKNSEKEKEKQINKGYYDDITCIVIFLDINN